MRFLIALCAFLSCLLLTGCCENEHPVEHPSPDSQGKYVQFSRNCGATTSENLQISLLQANQPLPDEEANTFIADNNHGVTQFVAQGEWVSARELRITYSSKSRVFKKESRVGPVVITYAAQE